MIQDKLEQKLIHQMALMQDKYYKPFDEMDSSHAFINREFEIKYETYKEILLELWEQ